ncbi:MAG TPA: hypothetical protein VMW41_01980 [Candidatus Bathyarchaeia archaeon]|nr:hypothetical protein [Candidatus Bathyarchaeia archaeon]
MNELKIVKVIKILVFILILGSWVVAGRVIYNNLYRATKIDPALVELYQPRLDTDLVKRAAEVLRGRESFVDMPIEETITEEKEATKGGVLE